MTLIRFADDWTVQSAGGQVQPVTLPHDAMLTEPRSPSAPSGSHGAYFAGGRYRYRRVWRAPEDVATHHYSLLFEGVYGHTRVSVDGVVAAEWNSGYRETRVPLDQVVRAGEEHLIEVDVDNAAQPNSRWYTGSGIYRTVWLEKLPTAHIDRRDVRIVTEFKATGTVARLTVPIVGGVDGDLVSASISGASVEQAALTAGVAELELPVSKEMLWSDLTPNLVDLTVQLVRGDAELDAMSARTGLRTVDIHPSTGLRINGCEVLLRGACVHHDNGVLGAATFRAAEFRRARLLKTAGYNAVRSAHNPLSRPSPQGSAMCSTRLLSGVESLAMHPALVAMRSHRLPSRAP